MAPLRRDQPDGAGGEPWARDHEIGYEDKQHKKSEGHEQRGAECMGEHTGTEDAGERLSGSRDGLLGRIGLSEQRHPVGAEKAGDQFGRGLLPVAQQRRHVRGDFDAEPIDDRTERAGDENIEEAGRKPSRHPGVPGQRDHDGVDHKSDCHREDKRQQRIADRVKHHRRDYERRGDRPTADRRAKPGCRLGSRANARPPPGGRHQRGPSAAFRPIR